MTLPIFSNLKKKASKFSQTKQAKLTKCLIEAADRINLRKLKLIQISARGRRLKFMHWIGDTTNLLHMFTHTQKILENYPHIHKPQKQYVNAAL